MLCGYGTDSDIEEGVTENPFGLPLQGVKPSPNGPPTNPTSFPSPRRIGPSPYQLWPVNWGEASRTY